MELRKVYIIYLLTVVIILWLLLHKSNVRRAIPPLPFSSNNGTGQNNSKGVILICNSIPKTGSTGVWEVIYTLKSKNSFNAKYIHVSSRNRKFSFMNKFKFEFGMNVSLWNSSQPTPFHGNFHFVNFFSMGFRQPIYISVIREPLERLVSHYYFKRHGDTRYPEVVRIYQGDKTTFDECVKQNGVECQPERLWLQIPYFCGCEKYCWTPGSEKALKRAKENIINSYLLVGTTNYLSQFFEMIESLLLLFFRGASNLYTKDSAKMIRKTKYKESLKPETVKMFKTNKIWQMENKFHIFIQTKFNKSYNDFKRAKKQLSSIELKTKNSKL